MLIFLLIVRRCFESLCIKALEPQTEAIALPVQDLHPVTRLVEEDEQHRIEHLHLNIQLDQGGQAIDGFSEIHRLGVEIDFFDFGVGAHHGGWLQKEIGAQHWLAFGSFEDGVYGALS
ncbi:hypothetical protein D3C84_962080 [compost metagenome]